jgi:hypothetical protein
VKRILSILLVLVSSTSFSQYYWRNSDLEQVVFEQINIHRQEMGLELLVWDYNNKTALPYSELLTSKIDEKNNQRLVHCRCHPGSEILADAPAVNYDNTPRPNKEIAEMMVYYWNRSPSHKAAMEYSKVVRASVAIQMYIADDGVIRSIAVVQFREPKQVYLDRGYGEDGENQSRNLPRSGLSKYDRLRNPWVWDLREKE